ncbi:transcriptional regulator of multiple amino acid permease [Ascoidea rubescens DSM 1968]|uniref:Transcriptional regulator of multiple amino acid permease n=1 Tax=Ascoidea rubescens DSM 1968 TaxID=1344418 RepID=A0A1D2VQ59_9ASCO|nr:transcriptional regulator of multiple amino acid permease [Ascoidea rubescens DSM 1968]ODV63760.1 transcriptional regulator of multiple amino acid permease [Ascoidea rubescens DSM 1968]
MIAFSGAVGNGLLLSSGKCFTIAGPLGTILGFAITGSVVLAAMLSYCEVVSFLPVADGVSGLSSRFIDDAFGFSLGWCYWASYAFGLASEITAGTIMLTYYPYLGLPSTSIIGWISFFIVVVFGINLVDVRVFGELEYIGGFIKSGIILMLLLSMILLNTGALPPLNSNVGFKYWDYSKSDFSRNLIYGLFRPTFDLDDNGTGGALNGIGGNKGRFLSLLVTLLISAYSYSGSEVVCIAAAEAKNPRKSLQSATKKVFWRILIFYVLSIFCVSLNIFAGDPRLLRYDTVSGIEMNEELAKKILVDKNYCHSNFLNWEGYSNGNQSPWIIAFQSADICSFSSVINGFFVFFALSSGSSQLYVSSRTLYSLAIQGKAPKFFKKCSASGVPYISVIFSGLFSCLSYACIDKKATSVFGYLINFVCTSGILVWVGMCLSFNRYYYGLKLRPDIISREDKMYPFRSPFQPYLSYYGLVGSSIIALLMGYTNFLRSRWDTLSFISSYGAIILFFLMYFGYKKLFKTRIKKLDQIDFDTGRKEIDRIVWDENTEYTKTLKDWFKSLISYA